MRVRRLGAPYRVLRAGRLTRAHVQVRYPAARCEAHAGCRAVHLTPGAPPPCVGPCSLCQRGSCMRTARVVLGCAASPKPHARLRGCSHRSVLGTSSGSRPLPGGNSDDRAWGVVNRGSTVCTRVTRGPVGTSGPRVTRVLQERLLTAACGTQNQDGQTARRRSGAAGGSATDTGRRWDPLPCQP